MQFSDHQTPALPGAEATALLSPDSSEVMEKATLVNYFCLARQEFNTVPVIPPSTSSQQHK